jgi:hypothetical protein
MQSHRSATHAADLWDRISGPLGAAVWCLPTMALAYTVVFATFWFGLIMTNGGVELPPPPPDLALPQLPTWVYVVLIAGGPCALAGGVVLALSRWWVGIAGGIVLGVLSATVTYLSGRPRPETPVFALVAWVLVGCIGSVIGQFRREWRRAIASRTTSARAGAEPGTAPNCCESA